MLLRLAQPEDAEGIRAIYAPIVADTAISFEYTPPSTDEMRRRIATTRPMHPWLVADDGAVAGYAYAGPYAARDAYRWSVAVTVYLRADARGQGLGRRLYTALFDLLAAQGYRTAFAGITLPNAASVGLHESMGFTPVGVARAVGFKLGAWHDVGQWQRSIAVLGDSPETPRRLDDLDPDVVTAALA